MKKQTFILKKDHIKLLRRAHIGWQNCEIGAPEIDPKRPYGNSDVAGDVCEILGIMDTELDRDTAMAIHCETAQALQIILITGRFTPGTHEKQDEYDCRSWKLIE